MRVLGIPVGFLAVPCLALAAVWLFIWPHREAEGAALLVLRWGHSAVWLLLAIAALAAALSPRFVPFAVSMAGVVYAAFLIVLVSH